MVIVGLTAVFHACCSRCEKDIRARYERPETFPPESPTNPGFKRPKKE